MPTPQIIDLVMITLTGYFIMSHFFRLGARNKYDDALQLRQKLLGSFDFWLGLIVCMCALAAVDLFVPYGTLFLLPLSACGLFNIIMDCMMFLITFWIKLTPKFENKSEIQQQQQQVNVEPTQKEENRALVQNETNHKSNSRDPYRSFY